MHSLAEILTQRIRNNPRIKGLVPPGSSEQVKLSQYTDDTIFMLGEHNSIKETLNTLSLYEATPGAKMNREKCKGLSGLGLQSATFLWLDQYLHPQEDSRPLFW